MATIISWITLKGNHTSYKSVGRVLISHLLAYFAHRWMYHRVRDAMSVWRRWVVQVQCHVGQQWGTGGLGLNIPCCRGHPCDVHKTDMRNFRVIPEYTNSSASTGILMNCQHATISTYSNIKFQNIFGGRCPSQSSPHNLHYCLWLSFWLTVYLSSI